jgi:non-specific serine/threonine protein kinase
VQICRRLDGVPLALELAASRLAVLGPTNLAQRLDEAFRLLVGTQRDAPRRHQTMRATLDWSHALLSVAEQYLFARLSLFAGGWTLEACEQVAGGDGLERADVVDILSALVAKSLVVAEPTPGGEVRFHFLEVVRQYAREHLLHTAGVSALRTRHRDWFLSCAERFNRALHSLDEPTEFDRLDHELDNLRAALEWSATETDCRDMDHVLSVAGRLYWFWQAHGYYREGREHIDRLLARAGADTVPASRADALIGAGALAWNQGGSDNLAAAREQLTEAVAIARELGDGRLQAHALAALALVVRDQGGDAFAGRLLREALKLAEATCDAWGQARALNGLGTVAVRGGDFARAIDCFQRSLTHSRELGDQTGVASLLGNLAQLAYRRGDFDSAIQLTSETIAMRRNLHVMWNLPHDLEVSAGVAARHRLAEQAARLYGAADRLHEQQGDTEHERTRHHHHLVVRDIASARAQLGALAFAQARSSGRGLSLEQAVQEALTVQEAVRKKPKRSPAVDALTRRESEVAQLVARGLTNQQIAAQLVFTRATAAKHVEHILDKLGFTSRSQIAAWFATATATPELLAPISS